MLCSYCGRERPDDEATDEHVVPRAIGGAVGPTNPFLLRTVCRQCNSAAGRYIDGAFIRSWLVNSARVTNAFRYVDLDANPILPLRYMGEIGETLWPGKTCEFWIGPTGDSIFYFHDPFPALAGPGVIGPPPGQAEAQDFDEHAFLFIASSNPAWHPAIVRSFVENFEHATLYLGNGPTIRGGRFSDIPPELMPLRARLHAMTGERLQVTATLARDFGQRFLAKLALGFGCLLLGPDFQRSVDAVRLRDAMWERDPEQRAALQIHGTPFLGEMNPHDFTPLPWAPGHVIVVRQFGQSLALSPFFYGTVAAVIEITSDRRFWQGRVPDEGLVFVIAPGLRTFHGPLPLDEYVAFRHFPATAPVALREPWERAETVAAFPRPNLEDETERIEAQREQVRGMVRRTAYEYWEERGRPIGDPLTDWVRSKFFYGVPDDFGI